MTGDGDGARVVGIGGRGEHQQCGGHGRGGEKAVHGEILFENRSALGLKNREGLRQIRGNAAAPVCPLYNNRSRLREGGTPAKPDRKAPGGACSSVG